MQLYMHVCVCTCSVCVIICAWVCAHVVCVHVVVCACVCVHVWYKQSLLLAILKYTMNYDLLESAFHVIVQ